MDAARTYVARPIEIPVAQFKTNGRPLHWRLLGDPRLAWRSLCRAGFQVREMQGPHGHPFFERYGAKIAAELERLLESGQVGR